MLGAGAGTRLRPLSRLRPKPLCPVAGVPLVDLALARVGRALRSPGEDPEILAVNVCHGRDAMEAHLAGRVHLSVEEEALGTAGALGALRPWLAGRAALVVNGDTWCPADLAPILAGWDGQRIRVLVHGPPPLGPRSGVVASLLPWPVIAGLAAQPAGLWEVVWRRALAEGSLESLGADDPFVDCATPADYLRANLAALAHAGVHSLVAPDAEVAPTAIVGRGVVVGAGAVVEGRLERCVLWPGTRVSRREVLVDAVRASDRVTVAVR